MGTFSNKIHACAVIPSSLRLAHSEHLFTSVRRVEYNQRKPKKHSTTTQKYLRSQTRTQHTPTCSTKGARTTEEDKRRKKKNWVRRRFQSTTGPFNVHILVHPTVEQSSLALYLKRKCENSPRLWIPVLAPFHLLHSFFGFVFVHGKNLIMRFFFLNSNFSYSRFNPIKWHKTKSLIINFFLFAQLLVER